MSRKYAVRVEVTACYEIEVDAADVGEAWAKGQGNALDLIPKDGTKLPLGVDWLSSHAETQSIVRRGEQPSSHPPGPEQG